MKLSKLIDQRVCVRRRRLGENKGIEEFEREDISNMYYTLLYTERSESVHIQSVHIYTRGPLSFPLSLSHISLSTAKYRVGTESAVPAVLLELKH